MTVTTEKKDQFTYTVLLALHLAHQAFKETVTSLTRITSLLPTDRIHSGPELMHTISDVSPVLAQSNETNHAAVSTLSSVIPAISDVSPVLVRANEPNQSALSSISNIIPVVGAVVAAHSSSMSTSIQTASAQSAAANQFSVVPSDFFPSDAPWQTISIKQVGLIVALFALMIHKYSNRDVESTLNNNKPTYVS